MKICCDKPEYKIDKINNITHVTMSMSLCPECLKLYTQYFGNGILRSVLESTEEK